MSEQDESIRPWGNYEILLDAEYCKVKRIFVNYTKTKLSVSSQTQEAWTSC